MELMLPQLEQHLFPQGIQNTQADGNIQPHALELDVKHTPKSN